MKKPVALRSYIKLELFRKYWLAKNDCNSELYEVQNSCFRGYCMSNSKGDSFQIATSHNINTTHNIPQHNIKINNITEHNTTEHFIREMKSIHV